MENFVELLENLFGSMQSYYESYIEVSATYSAKALPMADDVLSFFSAVPFHDTMVISLYDAAEDSFTIDERKSWQAEYPIYIEKTSDSKEFTIKITIEKNISKNGAISIYSFENFCNFLSKQPVIKLLHIFEKIYSAVQASIVFSAWETGFELYTDYISLMHCSNVQEIHNDKRELILKRCEDASAFLDFHVYRLIPQDFHVVRSTQGTQDIVKIFHKLETILSVAYIANTAYINENRIVLQIDPGHAFDISFEQLLYQENLCRIFQWAYENDMAMERISIVRNILKLYCKSAEQLLEADEGVFTSIKSNYNIYQKDTTEKYFEMKEQIANFIAGLTAQMQELVHGLVDGLKNNFIAIVTFAITVLLTNSLADEDLLTNQLPRNLVFVSTMFIAATVLYWAATMIATIVKWRLIRQGYDQIKTNYRSVFDERDLREAFNNDSIMNASKRKVIWYSITISILWLIFVVAMILIICQYANFSAIFSVPSVLV